MAFPTTRKVLRYRPAQRLVHWLGVTSVLTLLLSGLALLWSPLSPLAVGGLSRRIHQIGAILFLLTPLVYVVLNPRGLKELLLEPFTYDLQDWEWLKRIPHYVLGHASRMPRQGRLNAGQKLHHAGTFLAFITVTISGLILWFGKGQLGATALALTVVIHDLSMLLLTILIIGHVYFTFVYGALPGMVSGYVPEEYARLEHARWLESLPDGPPWIIETAEPSHLLESAEGEVLAGQPADRGVPSVVSDVRSPSSTEAE